MYVTLLTWREKGRSEGPVAVGPGHRHSGLYQFIQFNVLVDVVLMRLRRLLLGL